jgi:hypothetical protein
MGEKYTREQFEADLAARQERETKEAQEARERTEKASAKRLGWPMAAGRRISRMHGRSSVMRAAGAASWMPTAGPARRCKQVA